MSNLTEPLVGEQCKYSIGDCLQHTTNHSLIDVSEAHSSHWTSLICLAVSLDSFDMSCHFIRPLWYVMQFIWTLFQLKASTHCLTIGLLHDMLTTFMMITWKACQGIFKISATDRSLYYLHNPCWFLVGFYLTYRRLKLDEVSLWGLGIGCSVRGVLKNILVQWHV